MRDTLEAVAAGDLSPAQAEAELKGYVTAGNSRFDASRHQRRGIPEAIFGAGKTPAQVTEIARTALETTGRALVTRVTDDQLAALEAAFATESDSNSAAVTVDQRGTTVLVRASDFEPPSLPVTVGLVTAGTVDGPVADEAQAVLEDAGVTVDRLEDVGVAALDRLLDHLDRLREADVLLVFAGREGALPTVVAGLVDTPVIGVPVSSGYGHGGNGEAALAGMLQSCTVLSVVNIDAGFVAGAQAVLIARAIAGSPH